MRPGPIEQQCQDSAPIQGMLAGRPPGCQGRLPLERTCTPASHVLFLPIKQVRAEPGGLGQQRTLAAMTWGGSMSGQASLPLSPATMPACEVSGYGASA